MIYGAAHLDQGASTLYTIDTTTGDPGTGVPILMNGQAGQPFQRVSGIDLDPATGVLYGTGYWGDMHHLATIDPVTGFATIIGNTLPVWNGSEYIGENTSDLSFQNTTG